MDIYEELTAEVKQDVEEMTGETITESEYSNEYFDAIKLNVDEAENFKAASEEEVSDVVKANLSNEYGLNEQDALNIATLIYKYKENNEKVANEDIDRYLPDSIKSMIRKQMVENVLPASSFYIAARGLISEIYNKAKIDANFNKLDAELQKVLQIPAIADMYFEEVAKNIDTDIPETCKKLIEDGETDKADNLMSVKEAFDRSVSLESLTNEYDTNTRAKRSVRRMKKFKGILDTFDYEYKCDKLNNPSIKEVYAGLKHIKTIEDDWNEISNNDIDKFIAMLYYCMQYLRGSNFINQVEIYYIIKNLSMLQYIEKGKTKFSTKYIATVGAFILHIKEEEAKREDIKKKK